MENYGNGNGFNTFLKSSNNYLFDLKNFKKIMKENPGKFEVVTARKFDDDGNATNPIFEKAGKYGNWICLGDQIVAKASQIVSQSVPHHKLNKKGDYYWVYIILKKI